MVKAPIPSNELQRHADLLSYDILDSLEEDDYNQLTELAAAICNCPISMVTFVDTERQWFKASKNVENKESARDASFCGHTILDKDVMVVLDASKDHRFFDNPNVTAGLKIGFYAGAPIVSTNGYHLGSLCVIDQNPRPAFGEKEQQALRVISNMVTRLLELRMKNKIIQQQSDALLKSERNLNRTNTINREKENDYIAYQLHENIAQILAAAKMNVETMGAQKEFLPQMVDNTRKYLQLMMDDVRALSYSITPTTFKSADYTDHINEMVDDFGRKYDMEIYFNKQRDALKLSATLGLTIYRIVQYQLEYAKLAGASILHFDLNTKLNTFLLFKHNGTKNLSNSDEASLLLSNINTRADVIRAVYTHFPDLNIMEISLPVEA